MPTVAFGLGFGDEGKGTTVELLASRKRSLVVRFNGGHQAGHNILRPDGTWHCFAQIGSGSFEGCETHLSRFMHIEPGALLAEAEVLATKGVDALPTLTIDPRALIVTPAHKMINQLREVANGHQVSTCGCGVGDAARDREMDLTVYLGDLGTPRMERELGKINDAKRRDADLLCTLNPSKEVLELREYFERRMDIPDLIAVYEELLEHVRVVRDQDRLDCGLPVIFEGSQGTLLDIEHGFTPYVTKSRATHHNAASLVEDASLGGLVKMGILPAFTHRHGNGPLPTEDPALLHFLADKYNPENEWQGPFRVGHFDALLARHAIKANEGIDTLCLTKLDLVDIWLSELKICNGYLYEGDLSELDGKVVYEALSPTTARIVCLTERWGYKLTPILQRCTPLDWKRASDLDHYVTLIEQELQVTAGLLSYGPTVEDKVAR